MPGGNLRSVVRDTRPLTPATATSCRPIGQRGTGWVSIRSGLGGPRIWWGARVAQQRIDPWIIAAVVVGTALRFVNLGDAPLWFDETYTVHHISLPWDGYVQAMMRDNQAPIYYAATKAWTELVGVSPWLLRLPGLVASIACIPLIAASTRLLAGATAARTAAWVAAISPFLVQHAQDARPYALLAAVAAAHFLVLVRFATGRSARLGFWWVALAIATVATHYYGIFVLAGQGLALLLLWRRPLHTWLPAGAIAGAICAALILAAVRNASGIFAGQYVFGIAALPGVVWSLLTGYTLIPTSEQLHALGPSAILPDLPVALAALPAAIIVGLASLRTLDLTGKIVLLATFGTALVVPFLYRLVAGAGVHPRYFAATIGPVLVLTAAGMSVDQLRSPRGIATLVLGAVMLYATVLHLRDTSHGREDVAAAGRWLDANVPPTEEILITSDEMEILARFHWPQRRFRLYPSERGVIPEDQVPGLVDGLPFPDAKRAIFLVGRAWLSDPEGHLQTALVERYPSCPGIDVPGIRIHCFRPSAAAVAAARATALSAARTTAP